MITSNDIMHLSEIIGAISVIGGFGIYLFRTIKKLVQHVDNLDNIYNQQDDLNKNIIAINDSLQNVECRLDNISVELNNQANELQSIKTQMKSNNDLTLNIAREKLLKILREVIDNNGWDSSEQYGIISKMYTSYVQNGGNSEICSLMEKAKNLKVYRNLVKNDEGNK